MTLEIHAVTPDRWDDLRRLFGDNGAYANCWCAWWRLSAKAFDTAAPAEREAVLHDAVASGAEPGLLAYGDGEPVGWVAVAPRSEFPRLNRSPHLKPVDDEPAWSVNCFWIARGHRGQGVAAALLDAAVEHAATHGASVVEGYPVDPDTRPADAASAYTGVIEMFRRAGFVEAARRSPTARVVMRRQLAPGRGGNQGTRSARRTAR